VVVVAGTGLATIESNVPKFAYAMEIDSVSPLTSGIRGGALVTIQGTGFTLKRHQNNVTIGDVPCKVVSASHTMIKCVAPAVNNAALDWTYHGGVVKATSTTAAPDDAGGSGSGDSGESRVNVNGGSGSGSGAATVDGTTTSNLVGAQASRIFVENVEHDEPFVHAWAATPSVLAVTPTAMSSALTNVVELELAQEWRGGNDACSPTMSFVSPSGIVRECGNLAINGTVARCSLARAAPLPADEQPNMFPRLQLCGDDGQMVVAHPEPGFAKIDIALRITNVWPPSGSWAGGTVLTVSGGGFVDKDEQMVRSALTYNFMDKMMVVHVVLADRNVPCEVTRSTFSTIECVTVFPEHADAVATAVAKHQYVGGGYDGQIGITVNDFQVAGCEEDPAFESNVTSHVYTKVDKFVCEFDYLQNTATVSEISPQSGTGETVVVIKGTGFGAEPLVFLGEQACAVTSYTATSATCVAPALTAGIYNVRVALPSGYAAHPASLAKALRFESVPAIDTIQPSTSSLRGGVVVTIEGHGFQPSEVGAGNTVAIGGSFAHVVEASLTRIIAVAPSHESGNVAVSVTVEPTAPAVALYGQTAAVVVGTSSDDDAHRISWGIGTSAADATVTVKKGDTVTWVLDLDDVPHTVVSGIEGVADGRFRSEDLVAGDEWSMTFDTAGEYEYYCDPHLFMTGVITVADELFALPTSFEATVGDGFEYDRNVTPSIDSIEPKSGFQGESITITGSRLQGDGETEVLIGAQECDVTSLTNRKVVCRLGPSPAGTHAVYVTVQGVGTAESASGQDVEFTSNGEVTRLSVAKGSFAGGTLVTIEGRGFGGGVDGRRRARRDGAWGGWVIYDRSVLAEEAVEHGTKVSFCGNECAVVESAYDSVTCETAPLNSVESITTYNNLEPEKLAAEAFISANAAAEDPSAAFDGNFAKHFEAAASVDGSSCWVGMDLGEDVRAVLTRSRFFPVHQYAQKTDGGKFEVSSDRTTWEELATVANPHQGWNWITLDPSTQSPVRYIRYVGASGSRCIMTQLEFYGYTVKPGSTCTVELSTTAPLSHPSLGPMSTDHELVQTVEPNEVTFTYDQQQTGVVTSVEPRFGSSLGGEVVTLSGTNLATDVGNATVTVNGKPCVVFSVASNGTQLKCRTTARGPVADLVPTSLVVSNAAPGMGHAMSKPGTRYRFLDRWSAINTWLNDQPPVEGDFITIPEDQTILLDVSPPKLSVLLVLGMLVFDRQDLNLDASYILVQGGVMEVGTEDEPFLQQATITLHGDRRKSIELPFIGSKVLAVADKGGFTTHGQGRGVDVPLSQKGVLDIHGKPRLRTWTKVAQTAEAGSTTIVTSEPTDFASGERVVVTAPHQEVTVDRRIDEYTFTIVEPLVARHVSEEWKTDDGAYDIDMRFEVALLSRNIIIQGAGLPRGDGTPTILEGDDEVPSEQQLFGVHTGAFHGGHYRVENTELRHCGQAGNLGRYCMHLHVNGDNPAPNTYLKSNSIHHSFQRATTIHGTHHSLVQNNVAYHVMGHTYFVEDGDETYNTFDANIGIFTRPHHMMLKSDKEPATFWTAIPTNFWRNNIATDSSARGAWFELTDQGVTLEFFNNSFHHNSGIGFRNYPNYSPPSPQYFYNNSYFRNGGNGLFYKQGGDNHHVHSKFAQNGVDLFWIKYSTHDDSRLIPNVKDCAFWGGRGAQAIFAPQAEYWYVNGSRFMNYESGAGVISGCNSCCSPIKLKQGAYTYRFERLEFENSPVRTEWTCPYKQIFYDLDGTLTGQAGGTTLPSYKFNQWDGECEDDASGTYNGGRTGMVCNNKVRVRRLQIWGNAPRELDDKKISLKKSELVRNAGGLMDRFGYSDKFGTVDWEQYHKSGLLYEGDCTDAQKSDGKTALDFSGCNQMDGLDWINYRRAGLTSGEFDGWAIPVVTHHDFYTDVDWHIDFQKLTMRWSEPFYFDEPYNIPLVGEESVLLRWPYADYRYRFRVNINGERTREVAWWDHKIKDGMAEAKQLTRMDGFAEGLVLRQDDSLKTTECCGEWKVALNPWIGVDAALGQAQLQFTAEALQCGPDMCSLPGDNAECVTGGLWDEDKCPCMKWSAATTWKTLKNADLNTADVTHTGKPPMAGESVEIPRLLCVVVDTAVPELDKLVVAGRLKFDGQDRRLDIDRFLVWGFLEVGSKASPYPVGSSAEIVLHGVRTSASLVATDQHFLGNKNLVVFGDVQLHGSPVATSWAPLLVTAVRGSSKLTMKDAVGWQAGDKLVITSTEYPEPIGYEDDQGGGYLEEYTPHQTEHVEIRSVSGNVITLTAKLQNKHHAETMTVGGKKIDLVAHVGVLSRNVLVRGEISDSPSEGDDPNWYTGYGGHIVVGEANYGSEDELRALRRAGEVLGVTQKLGSLHATNVQFSDMGKLASEHAAITYRYFSELAAPPVNVVESCAFVNGWNYVVVTDKSFAVNLIGNVMSRSFRSAVDIDQLSKGTVVKNNLIAGVHRSPDEYNPECLKDSSCSNNPFAGIFMWNSDFAALSGNVVSGSEDLGFALYPVDACGAANPRVSNNEVYGAVVGMYLLDARFGDGQCMSVHGTKAWKNAHIGILTVDQSKNLKIVHSVVSDNHEGISLNFVQTGWTSVAAVEDSVVMGSTAVSDDCTASVTCRASKMGDTRGLNCNSVFGSGWRRVGIVMPQYTNLKKTCEGQGTGKGGTTQCRPPNRVFRMCSLPWEARFGNPDVQHARFEITRTTFAHWSATDCKKKSLAIALNPSQPDMAPETFLSEIVWDESVQQTARYTLGDARYQNEEATACTDSCDAVNSFRLRDMDGTTVGHVWNDGSDIVGSQFDVLSSFNPAQAAAEKCRADPDTRSIVCRDYSMARLVIESDPHRNTKRRIGPATITKYSEETLYEGADDRTYWSVGPFAQSCSCQKHFPQFTFDVEPGLEYAVDFSGVLWDRNQIQYHSDDPTSCIVARVSFSKPQTVDVVEYGTNTLVPAVATGVLPTVDDPPGTNLVSTQDRMLFITMCGHTSGHRVYWMSYGDLVQVTVTIRQSIDEFFAAQDPNSRTTATDAFVSNIAQLLEIDESQIKVTCVHLPGEPCIPLDGTRRARRQQNGFNATAVDDDDFAPLGTDVAAAVGEATGEGEQTLIVEFTVSVPDAGTAEEANEADETDTQASWCLGGCKAKVETENEANVYLSSLVYFIMDQVGNGKIEKNLAKVGYPNATVQVEYKDLLGSTTTTTTITNTSTTTATTTTTTCWNISAPGCANMTVAEAAESGMSPGAAAALAIVLLLVLGGGVTFYLVQSNRLAENDALTGPKSTWKNPMFDYEEEKPKSKPMPSPPADPNWQKDTGALQFVSGKAKVGGDQGESYFSSRSRAQLVQDSLMVRRPDESSTDDIDATQKRQTSHPRFSQDQKLMGEVQRYAGEGHEYLDTKPNPISE
jgi:hypothetical protein